MSFKLYSPLIFLTLFNFSAISQDEMVIKVESETGLTLIGKQTYFFADSSNDLSFDDIRFLDSKGEFKIGEKAYTNFTSSRLTYWLKFTVQNETEEDLELRIGKGWIAFIDFYSPDSLSNYEITETGYFRAFDSRQITSNQFRFKLSDRDDNSPKTFYAKIATFGYAVEAPLFIGTNRQMAVDQQKEDWLTALYTGAIIIMICYSLIYYLIGGEKSYLFYLLYLLTLLYMLPFLTGSYPQYWLYRSHGQLNFYYFFVVGFNPVFIIFFVKSFFNLDYRKNLFLKFAYFFCSVTFSIGLINLISGLTGNYHWWLPEFSLSFLLAGSVFYLAILIVVIQSYRNGLRQARYLLVGWTIYFVGIWLVIASYEFDFIPLNFFTAKAIMLGSFIEIVMFSMALTDKLNLLKAEKRKAEVLALDKIVENERIVQRQNIMLERMVFERTLELDALNRDLNFQSIHLEELNQEKDGLLELVAKDLRMPLKGIQRISNLVGKEEGLSENMKTYFQMVDKLSNNGRNLIKDLLTVSKCKEEISQEHLSPICIEAFFNEIISPFYLSARQKQISLEVNVNVSKEDCFINEPSSVRRIVENLISNAIKFTPIGGKVDVGLEKNLDATKFSIKDTGPGFTKDDMKKMFNKFQRLSAVPTKNESSTGLGLSIVKSLCDRINATIDISSNLGGTKFEIRFRDYFQKYSKVLINQESKNTEG